MTTTESYQKIPNFFLKKEEVVRKQTNPRYPNFDQIHFTAGDIDQFEMYRDKTNGLNPMNINMDLSNNVWEEEVGENINWPKYNNLTTESVDNTFLYMFNKFKKGVFVKIKDNKLDVFLPFSKHNYTNEWGNRLKHPPQFKDMTSFLIYSSKLQGYNIDARRVNTFPNTWYANNCLIRTEYPIGENDRCVSNLKDMLLTLCEKRQIPDIELFFNRRDFPLIKNDNSEPYEHIFDNEKMPLISHNYTKYCPILSMVTTDKNADIPFPTMEDWARVSSLENKLFYPDFKNYSYTFELDWSKKVPTAFFRGASTGCGVTVETNPRLKLALLSKRSPVEKGVPLLDAGISKWNCRPRKIINQPYLEVIDPVQLKKQYDLDTVPFLSPEEQSRYKYIINVDGHVSAFRLSLELSMGSVVLLQESKYRIWFRKYLKEYVHYVPIKEDLSDLLDKIRWCRENDDKCKEIAIQSKQFYDTYLTKKGMLDFVQLLFINIKKNTGTYFYNYANVKDIIYQYQWKKLNKEKTDSVLDYPFDDIDGMRGLELFLDKHYFPKERIVKLIKEHESKDSTIHYGEFEKILISLKTSKRQYELVNEAFVGKKINRLLNEIPNLKYTLGFDKNVLISEYVKGVKFSEYIKTCQIDELVAVLKILLLTLCVAQERLGFVHNDLTPWNIIIKKLKTKTHFIYQFKDQLFSVYTDTVPVIIDYDKTHIIDKNVHHGINKPFQTSKIQDSFCLIVNTVHEYCQKKLNPDEYNKILHMINFFTETDFYPRKITQYNELMEFLQTNKKYNEIVYKDKCDLEQKEPSDILYYLNSLEDSKMIIIENIDGKKVNNPCRVYINPSFYYSILTRQNNHKAILEYINKIENFIKYNMDKFLVNFIFYIHSMNSTYKIIEKLILFIQAHKDYKTSDEVFIEIRNCNRVLSLINTEIAFKHSNTKRPVCGHFENSVETKENTVFCSICEKERQTIQYHSNILLSPNYHPSFFLAKYDVNSFSNMSYILTILQSNSVMIKENYISIRYMIRDTLLYHNRFSIYKEKEFAKKYGCMLFNLSPLTVLNNNANIHTIKMISKELYEIDKEHLEKLKDKPERQLRTIKNILAIV
jgi:hypothetical protein